MYSRQLETFVQVAEQGSFSKAAQAMYITPTAVIRQMNLLEKHLGVTLFRRNYQGVELTPAGACVLEGARHIISYSQDVLEHAKELDQAAKAPVLRVGTAVMTPATPILKLLPLVRMSYPDLKVRLVSFENTPDEVRRIFGNIDAAGIDVFTGIFEDAYLEARKCAGSVLSHEPLQLAMSQDHALAQKDELTLEDLAGQTILLPERGWNRDIDALRQDLEENHPEIGIRDFAFYSIDVFNICANEGMLLVTISPWREVHPLLKTVPVWWDHRVSFGIIHDREPSVLVQAILDAAEANKVISP